MTTPIPPPPTPTPAAPPLPSLPDAPINNRTSMKQRGAIAPAALGAFQFMGGLQHLLRNICEVKKTNKQKPTQKQTLDCRHRDRIRRVTDAAAAAQQNCTGDPLQSFPLPQQQQRRDHSLSTRSLAHSETLGCAKP